MTAVKKVVICGGVAANMYLRKRIRNLVRQNKGEVFFPISKLVTGDNAGMIGVAADAYLQIKKFIQPNDIDRIPRMKLMNNEEST